MKMKSIIGALSIVCVAGAAFAQTNVLSQNAVGYVKVTADEGSLYLIRNDFLDIDGNTLFVADVIGDQVPLNSRIITWDGTGFQAASLIATMAGNAWSGPGSTVGLDPGVGFFLEIATGGGSASYDVFLLGEVPGANNASDTTDLNAGAGLSLLGYPYPASTDWTATVLAGMAGLGDRLVLYDGGYVSSTLIATMAGNQWSGGGETEVLEPGEGFFYDNTGGALIATEVKPYAWP